MKVIDTIAAQADAMAALRRDIHAHPELCFEEQRTADLKKRGEATKALYASLDADQKKTLDSMSGRWMDGQRQSHRPHQH